MSDGRNTSSQKSDKQDQQRADTLQKYVSDMVAVEEHIGEAVKRQADDREVYQHNPQASQIISDIAELTHRHEDALKQHLKAIGGDPAKGLKEVATAAMGAVAGMYDKMRNETVSKMLRDDYTALNLAAVSYTMLHTTGLALDNQSTAALALRHLQDYTKIIMEINQIIPGVVVAELRDDGAMVNESLLQQAVDNTQRVWQPSNGGYHSPRSTGQSRAVAS